MHLGDWIEFDTIVVKQTTATGSTPASFRLGRTRQGMVIGARAVYDVALGTPPTLMNRQEVLLVAVSLHRCYRVFPAAARPTTPPSPRQRPANRRSQTAASTAIVLSQGGTAMNGRTSISQPDLELLVANELNQQLTAGVIFTAYDVTSALRATHPQIDLPHAAVKQAVHAHMETVVASGLYDREQATFGTATAWRYVPL